MGTRSVDVLSIRKFCRVRTSEVGLLKIGPLRRIGSGNKTDSVRATDLEWLQTGIR